MSKPFPCPGCGADLTWSPGEGNLTCAFCGHHHVDESLRLDFQPPRHALDEVAALARRSTPWGIETRAVSCAGCGASYDVEPTVENAACPFCGSEALNPSRGEAEALLPADALAPFAVTRDDAARAFRAWLGGLWFRPGGLKDMARLGQLQGSYIPTWCFDLDTRARWTAERGHHTWEEEEVVDAQGQRSTRRVQKTRWEPASGRHEGAWRDVLVNASKAIDQRLLEGLLPYQLGQLRAYDPAFLQGFAGERYQLALEGGEAEARKIVRAWVEKAAKAQVGGDTQRNFRMDLDYLDPRFSLLLLPVWIAAYQYGGRSYRYVVNGQTGLAHGEAPLSWPKVIAAVLVALAFIAALVLASR